MRSARKLRKQRLDKPTTGIGTMIVAEARHDSGEPFTPEYEHCRVVTVAGVQHDGPKRQQSQAAA